MNTTPSSGQLILRKHLSSSILLWMRTDQPRQTGMDHWKGPHSEIVSATPGLEEYRQLHLAETNPGSWAATSGIETGTRSQARPRRSVPERLSTYAGETMSAAGTSGSSSRRRSCPL